MTYLLLSAAFLGAAGAVAMIAAAVRRRRGGSSGLGWQAVVAGAAVLLALTAVFDNVMIAAGLFSYADEQISGVRLGLAPIEDFSYPIAAVVLLPALWILTGSIGTRGRRAEDDH